MIGYASTNQIIFILFSINLSIFIILLKNGIPLALAVDSPFLSKALRANEQRSASLSPNPLRANEQSPHQPCPAGKTLRAKRAKSPATLCSFARNQIGFGTNGIADTLLVCSQRNGGMNRRGVMAWQDVLLKPSPVLRRQQFDKMSPSGRSWRLQAT